MNINLKNNKKASYIFKAVGLLSCLGMFAYIYMNYISQTPIHVDASETVQDMATEKNQSKPEEKSKSINSINNITKNPFIDLSEIRTASNNGKGTIPVANNVVASSGNDGLPQIPSGYPRPNVGSVPLPSIPGNGTTSSMPTPAQLPQTAQTSVKGVFTGNNGANMAIMSDGKIVSTGDTYQDGRIAYIGGDGIQFDDGHTIAYK